MTRAELALIFAAVLASVAFAAALESTWTGGF